MTKNSWRFLHEKKSIVVLLFLVMLVSIPTTALFVGMGDKNVDTSPTAIHSNEIVNATFMDIMFEVLPEYFELGVPAQVSIFIFAVESDMDVTMTFEIRDKIFGFIVYSYEEEIHLNIFDAVYWTFDVMVALALVGDYNVVTTLSAESIAMTMTVGSTVEIVFMNNWEAFFSGILVLLGFGGLLGVLVVGKAYKKRKSKINCDSLTLTPDEKITCSIE